jgi:hypothetical protein
MEVLNQVGDAFVGQVITFLADIGGFPGAGDCVPGGYWRLS